METNDKDRAKEALDDLGRGAKGLFEVGKKKLYQGIGAIEHQVSTRTGVFGGLAEIVDSMVTGAGALIGDAKASFQEAFYTDGKYDPKKAEAFIEGKADAVEKFGKKTYAAMVDMAQKGAKTLASDYRAIVPTQVEKATTYAGIGTDAKGIILLRPDLDACIDFYNAARAKLPSRLTGRQELLDSIKASASSSPIELMTYFTAKDNPAARKIVEERLMK